MTQNITLHISSEMADAIALIARTEDATPGEIIRDAIRRDLRRRALALRSIRLPDERLTPLRDLLAADFTTARSWQHLQGSLSDKGYRLLISASGLVVHRTSGERVCRITDLGHSLVELTRRFKQPFPQRPPVEAPPQAMAG